MYVSSEECPWCTSDRPAALVVRRRTILQPAMLPGAAVWVCHVQPTHFCAEQAPPPEAGCSSCLSRDKQHSV